MEEFEHEYGDIDGQISLNVNGYCYGYCLENLEIGGEHLLYWFWLLNKAVSKLNQNKYVAFSIPDTHSSWFEFVLNDGVLSVSMIEVPPVLGYLPDIVTKPFQAACEGDWKDIKVFLGDFRHEVIKKTNMFLEIISSINPILIKSTLFSEVREMNNK